MTLGRALRKYERENLIVSKLNHKHDNTDISELVNTHVYINLNV